MRKKISVLSLLAILVVILPVSIISNSRVNLSADKLPDEFSCSYFFNNDYDSIYEINHDLKERTDTTGEYKTWGTVTCQWLDNSNRTNTYIQSRDANGNDAAICLYNMNTPEDNYPIGSVVEINATKDKATIYNGMPEFKAGTTVTKLFDSNPYPVEIFKTNSDYWKDGNDKNSMQFLNNYYYGPRKAMVENVTLSYSGSGNEATLTFADDVSFSAFVGSFQGADAIRTKLTNLNGETVNAIGYLSSYINGSSGKMELLLRDADDITLVEKEKIPSSLSIKEYVDQYVEGDSFISPDVYVVYDDLSESIADVNYISFDGFDSDSVGYKSITVNYNDGEHELTTSFIIYVGELELETLVIDDSISISRQYATGNYGSTYYSGYSYGFYRAYGDDFVELMALDSVTNIKTMNSCFYNITPIKNIKKMQIYYKTAANSGYFNPKISYGENNYQHEYLLDYSTNLNNVEIDSFDGQVNYFRVESGSNNMIIEKIIIKYLNTETINGSEFMTEEGYKNQYRTNIASYSGELVAGVSSMTVPYDVTIDNGSYIVNQYKTYTYYDYDYVYDHLDIAKSLALTDPIDVANYFAIFKTYPCNYVSSGNYSYAYTYFEERTRVYSKYTRTDGYATAIPYAVPEGASKPTYYELDIDITGDYASKSSSPIRGTGRLVCWLNGLDVESYNNSIVSYYTDDHYSTFQEFNNLGSFLPRFNVELRLTNNVWSEPITI